MSAESETLAPDVSRKLIDTGKLFHALAADPKFRPRVLGLIKEAAPDTVIPELEIAADVDRRVTERVKPYEETAAGLRSEINDLKSRLARTDMQTKLGLEDDELVEVETLAKEGGITNVETATEFYRLRQQALGVPRGTRDPGADDYQSKLRKVSPRNHAGLKRAAIEESTRVLRTLRGGRRAG